MRLTSLLDSSKWQVMHKESPCHNNTSDDYVLPTCAPCSIGKNSVYMCRPGNLSRLNRKRGSYTLVAFSSKLCLLRTVVTMSNSRLFSPSCSSLVISLEERMFHHPEPTPNVRLKIIELVFRFLLFSYERIWILVFFSIGFWSSSLIKTPKNLVTSPWNSNFPPSFFHLCWALNSQYFQIVGDGHQPNRMVYIHFIYSL